MNYIHGHLLPEIADGSTVLQLASDATMLEQEGMLLQAFLSQEIRINGDKCAGINKQRDGMAVIVSGRQKTNGVLQQKVDMLHLADTPMLGFI